MEVEIRLVNKLSSFGLLQRLHLPCLVYSSTSTDLYLESIMSVNTSAKQPNITLYFLQASRCIRTAWLFESLNLPYNVKFSDRVNNKAPDEFKQLCGNPLGKFPTLHDGDLKLWESGTITEYLCETYDMDGTMMPLNGIERYKTMIWVHAAEGTFLLHALAITYTRWNAPEDLADGHKNGLEKGLSMSVLKDLDWLEMELEAQGTGWLVGAAPSAADIMMHFSIQFIFARELGVKGAAKDKWKNIRKWLADCGNDAAYKKAVEKTGYTLFPKTM